MTDDLDRVIDDVARRMTAARPPADLRAQVLAQIEQLPRWSFWKLVPIAVGALAVVVVAVITLRAPHKARTPAPDARAASTGTTAASAGMSADVESPTESIARKIVRSDMTPPSLVLLEWQARAIAALPEPETLVLESIATEPLEVPQLEMQPLNVSPIDR